MKRILLIVLIVATLALAGCTSDKVCYTQAELDEMYGALENTDTSEGAISYAPAQGNKVEIYDALKSIMNARVEQVTISCRECLDKGCGCVTIRGDFSCVC